MDLLITVLGNAVVHEDFREKLLTGDPVAEAEAWGFRLTKGENEMLHLIFNGGSNKKELREQFNGLADQVYANLKILACERPCKMSVSPPKYPPTPAKAA